MTVSGNNKRRGGKSSSAGKPSAAAAGDSTAAGGGGAGVDEVFLPKDDIEENDDDFEKELNEFKRWALHSVANCCFMNMFVCSDMYCSFEEDEQNRDKL